MRKDKGLFQLVTALAVVTLFVLTITGIASAFGLKDIPPIKNKRPLGSRSPPRT